MLTDAELAAVSAIVVELRALRQTAAELVLAVAELAATIACDDLDELVAELKRDTGPRLHLVDDDGRVR